LATPTGAPVSLPTPGTAGHAFFLSDQQVLIHKSFKNFPSDELTVEFWMLSTDTCRKGTPFSYATGSYGHGDNSFLIFDYNDFGVSIMEDEGSFSDHTSGIATTDGKWTHVAVTWRSYDGRTTLYINGREVWTVWRGRGQHIPSGGTLILGREQDVEGGGFDSGRGAVGPVDKESNLEYGAQDFFGLIDEMRIWKKARTQEQIAVAMRSKVEESGKKRKGRGGNSPSINPSDPDLVAYWTFDEGQGYTVKDITNNGHDLLATQPPRWEVVRYFAICGNGVVEGLEECDTGAVGKGTGCTAECTIEKGWECSFTSPSKCWKGEGKSGRGGRGGGGGGYPGPAPGPGDDSTSDTSSNHHRSVAKTVLAAFTAIGIATTVVVAVVTQREVIYDRYPIVETAVNSGLNSVAHGFNYVYDAVSRGLGSIGLGGTSGGTAGAGGGYSYAGDLSPLLDAGESGSPSFTASMPPPERGVYSPLPARAPQGP
jgi:cysteine-rich repeat protein